MSKNAAPFGALELRRYKLTEQIAEIIQEMVNSHKLKVGDSLPPERDLADLFKVNRTAIHRLIKRPTDGQQRVTQRFVFQSPNVRPPKQTIERINLRIARVIRAALFGSRRP